MLTVRLSGGLQGTQKSQTRGLGTSQRVEVGPLFRACADPASRRFHCFQLEEPGGRGELLPPSREPGCLRSSRPAFPRGPGAAAPQRREHQGAAGGEMSPRGHRVGGCAAPWGSPSRPGRPSSAPPCLLPAVSPPVLIPPLHLWLHPVHVWRQGGGPVWSREGRGGEPRSILSPEEMLPSPRGVFPFIVRAGVRVLRDPGLGLMETPAPLSPGVCVLRTFRPGERAQSWGSAPPAPG